MCIFEDELLLIFGKQTRDLCEVQITNLDEFSKQVIWSTSQNIKYILFISAYLGYEGDINRHVFSMF